MKRTQMGSITVYLVIFAIVATVIGLLAWDRNSLSKEVKTLTGELTIVKKDRDDALEAVKILKNDLVTQRELTKVGQEQIQEHLTKLKIAEGKLEDLEKKLPKVKPRSEEPPVSKEDNQRSYQRILTLWEIYCIDPSREGCVKSEEVKK